MKGLYIHIPFCKSKCYYCNFFSFSKPKNIISLYVEALKLEIKYKKNINFNFDTIYIGGGTPSVLETKEIKDIFDYLQKYMIKKKIKEITIEINPESIDIKKLKEYFDLGINRLSIGCQTFIPKYLKTLGRTNTVEQTINSIINAKKIGFKNISLDLIYGLPKQTISNLLIDLENIIKLNINHVSYYGLSIEKNTFLYKQIKEKKIALPNEKYLLQMRNIINNFLEKHNFKRYEISNYSKEKKYSKHNLIYWNHEEYISIGANASNFFKKKRWQNQISLNKYIEEAFLNKFKKINEHKIKNQEYIFEGLMLGLRLIKGIKISSFNKKYNINILNLYKKEIDILIEQKCLLLKKGRMFFSEKGLNISNYCLNFFVNY